MALEGGNVNNAYMDTWIAARIGYGSPVENPAWVQDPCVAWLLNHAIVEPGSINCTGSSETHWNKDAFRQETGWFNVSGGSTYTLNLDGTGVYAILSDGRTINSTTSSIPTGTSFMLCAGPEKGGSITVELTGPGKAYAGTLFIPKVNNMVQSIVAGAMRVDPLQNTKAIANFNTP